MKELQNKVIFISGKITGERIYECCEKFHDAWLMILDEWHGVYYEANVINPLDLKGIHFDVSHEEAMKICFEALKDCTHIYMLRDWKESKGAMMEHDFAIENNIKIIYEK